VSAIAAIHVARKQLGLDEDTYRALAERVTGKSSSKDMTEAEREQLLEEFRRRGFKKAPSRSRKRLEGQYAGKLQALWISAWNLGLVQNRDDRALVAFVKRQTGVEHVRFLHYPEDAAKAIEALKGWMERAAGVEWHVGPHMADWERQPGFRVAWAQWRLLHPGELPNFAAFRRYCEEHAFNPLTHMTAKEWTGVMNRLGERVRSRK
jgi:phage gp16-like protein